MQMQIFLSKHQLFFILLIVILVFGCGEGEDKPPNSTLIGSVSGTVIDAETKNPVPGAIVKISGSETTTAADGSYILNDIPYGENLDITIQEPNFETHTLKFSLNKENLILNAELSRLKGTVSGTVTDAKTENPIPGVVVKLLGLEVKTEADGGFTFQDVPYSAEQTLTVQDPDYQEYTHTFKLEKARLVINAALTPLKDPEVELNAFLEKFSDLIESLDSDNLPKIQALFSETYVASDDPVTTIGIVAGVVAPSYEDVIPTFISVFDKYSWLQFSFKDRVMDITHARKAAIELLLEVDSENAETGAIRHLEAKCLFEFRREGSDWKIVYWQLLSLDVRL